MARLIVAACSLLAGCTLVFSDEAEEVAEARQRLLQCPARQLQVTAVELPYRLGAGSVPRLELGDEPEQYLRNQLGQTYGFLSGVHPLFDAAPTVAARLGQEFAWNVRLHRCDQDRGRFAVAVAVTGADEVGAVAALGRLEGTRAVLDEPGRLWMPLAALADPLGTSAPGGLLGEYGRLIVDDWDAPRPRLTMGAAFPLERVKTLVAEPVAAFFTDRLAANDSDFAREIDLDRDGVVSPDELLANSLANALFSPDLDETAALPDGGQSLVLPLVAAPR